MVNAGHGIAIVGHTSDSCWCCGTNGVLHGREMMYVTCDTTIVGHAYDRVW